MRWSENWKRSVYGFKYNCEDKVRRSHDVEIFEDGEIRLLEASGCENEDDSADSTESGGPGAGATGGGAGDTGNGSEEDKEDNRASVTVRRTDIMRVRRAKGHEYMQTYYHFAWPNEGKDMYEKREVEYKTIEWMTPATENTEAVNNSVEIPLIKSMSLRSHTGHKIDWANFSITQGQHIRKRIIFNNVDDGGGRIYIVKNIGGTKGSGPGEGTEGGENSEGSQGIEIEVMKQMRCYVSTGKFYRQTRFHAKIWGDGKLESLDQYELYKEPSSTNPAAVEEG